MQKDKTPRKGEAAYWCTCSTDPNTCMGCTIDRLVEKVLGPLGSSFLNTRVYKLRKK